MAILGPKKAIPSLPAARLQRWALILAAYDYDLEFRLTLQHCSADGLSRLPLPKQTTLEYSSAASVFNISQIDTLPITATTIQQATRKDPIVSKVLYYVQTGWPSQVPAMLQPYFVRKHELSVEADCLLWGTKVVVPQSLQETILQELHPDHPAASKMKALARCHIWWPGLDTDIERLARSCVSCQSVKQAPPAAPLIPWSWPTKPGQRVHIDFAGPFLNKMYFLAVDAHSKWPEVFELNQTTSSKTIAVLRHLFAMYGIPEQIVSDNGPQFVLEEF